MTRLNEYDQSGLLIKYTDGGGRTIEYGYDTARRLSTVTGPEDNLSNPALYQKVLTYDLDGNVVRRDVHEIVPETTSPSGEELFSKLFDFDTLDRLTDITDELGNLTHLRNDSRNAIWSQSDPLKNVVKWEYDVFGNKVTESKALTDSGLGGGKVIQSYETQKSYDGDGNIVQVTDPRGNNTEYGYDALGRLNSITYGDGTGREYGYDPNGNMVSLTNSNGLEILRMFDPLNRLKAVALDTSGSSVPYPPLGETFETRSYNGAGDPLVIKNDTSTITRKFDTLGRPYQERQDRVAGRKTTSFLPILRGFDGSDNRTSLQYPSGRVLQYQYDVGGRLQEILDATASAANPTALVEYSYRGRRLGRRSITRTARDMPSNTMARRG